MAHEDVVLAGYSMGADVLPAIVNRLPLAEQRRIRSIVLMAPGRATDYEFHSAAGCSTFRKMRSRLRRKLREHAGGHQDDLHLRQRRSGTLVCALRLDANKPTLTLKALPGAHHFDGDYEGLGEARSIAAQARYDATVDVLRRTSQRTIPVGTDGFEFVEYAAPDPELLRSLFARMGFPAVARHRSKNVTLHKQGDINFIINAEADSFAQQFAKQHGPCACAMAFRVTDARKALEARGGGRREGVPEQSRADGAEHSGDRGHRRKPAVSRRPLQR